jgi:hypothetical protein
MTYSTKVFACIEQSVGKLADCLITDPCATKDPPGRWTLQLMEMTFHEPFRSCHRPRIRLLRPKQSGVLNLPPVY